MIVFYIPVIFVVLMVFICNVFGHGSMTVPLPRGSLSTKASYVPGGFDPSAPVDYKPHFPAGDKTASPGSGLKSQIYAAGPPGWVPFNPVSPLFRWRYGVCGDSRSPVQEHLRGGIYYHGAKIVGAYNQGSKINIEIKINAHHNGFFEIHLCDVEKCNGEISEQCFKRGHCTQLIRAKNEECDSGLSKRCAPIDKNYPGRWYLPCSTVPADGKHTEFYGEKGRMAYLLPRDITCDHCVLQWFWTAANSCNPPGVTEYFDGPDGPQNWGNCPGQGGAIGGVARNKPCGGDAFPEEYLQCADIRILPEKENEDIESSSPTPELSQTSSTAPSKTPSSRVSSKPSVIPTSSPNVSATPKSTPFVEPTQIQDFTPTPRETIDPSPSENYSRHRRPYGKYNVSEGRVTGWGSIRDIVLIGDGLRIVSLYSMPEIDISMFDTVSIEAVTEKRVQTVTFFVNGKEVFVDKKPRFYISGKEDTRAPRPWVDVDKYQNRWVRIMVVAERDTDGIYLKLKW